MYKELVFPLEGPNYREIGELGLNFYRETLDNGVEYLRIEKQNDTLSDDSTAGSFELEKVSEEFKAVKELSGISILSKSLEQMTGSKLSEDAYFAMRSIADVYHLQFRGLCVVDEIPYHSIGDGILYIPANMVGPSGEAGRVGLEEVIMQQIKAIQERL